MKFYCITCGSKTKNPKMKGTGWIELVLWLCYMFPGLIYTLWRRTCDPTICPICNHDSLIPDALKNQINEHR